MGNPKKTVSGNKNALLEEFRYYYSQDEKGLEEDWLVAPIAIDTNVLLHLHRYPVELRDRLKETLLSLGDRLHIPYHVCVEYHLLRDGVILEQRENLKKVRQKLKNGKTNIVREINSLNLKNRLSFDVIELNKRIEQTIDSEIQKLKQHDGNAHPDKDAMVKFVRRDLMSRVWAKPEKDFYEECVSSFEKRVKDKVKTPGDSDADEKSDEKVFWSGRDGSYYTKRAGDYIIWRQLLDYFAGTAFIWISDDVKEDWVRKVGNRIVGPQRNLLYEAAESQIPYFLIGDVTELMRRHSNSTMTPKEIEMSRQYRKNLALRSGYCDPEEHASPQEVQRGRQLLSELATAVANKEWNSAGSILTDFFELLPMWKMSHAGRDLTHGLTDGNPSLKDDLLGKVTALIWEFENWLTTKRLRLS
ncbi:MAG TPA: hypothetical protein EYO33_10255 [Phycisphaerales bacterium]|nr:hypothetical protein [Phycisphaerales bacterium]|tara:strand:- start:440 stop:1684 length:1245 start_codon:yes stop_codon:yes gene_type:complete